jgi:hypothetical protein
MWDENPYVLAPLPCAVCKMHSLRQARALHTEVTLKERIYFFRFLMHIPALGPVLRESTDRMAQM